MLLFEDERYVRVYTRKTVTIKRLGWEGRAVWHALLVEFDRAGIFALSGSRPVDAVHLVSEIPREIVAIGLEKLFDARSLVHIPEHDVLYAPRFMEAQEAIQSDAARSRAKRERVRAREVLNEIADTRRVGGDTSRVTVRPGSGDTGRDGATRGVSLDHVGSNDPSDTTRVDRSRGVSPGDTRRVSRSPKKTPRGVTNTLETSASVQKVTRGDTPSLASPSQTSSTDLSLLGNSKTVGAIRARDAGLAGLEAPRVRSGYRTSPASYEGSDLHRAYAERLHLSSSLYEKTLSQCRVKVSRKNPEARDIGWMDDCFSRFLESAAELQKQKNHASNGKRDPDTSGVHGADPSGENRASSDGNEGEQYDPVTAFMVAKAKRLFGG